MNEHFDRTISEVKAYYERLSQGERNEIIRMTNENTRARNCSPGSLSGYGHGCGSEITVGLQNMTVVEERMLDAENSVSVALDVYGRVVVVEFRLR